MISAGLKGLNLDASLRSACREIIFLAPPYANFRKSRIIYGALEHALSAAHGASLSVLSLPAMESFPWVEEYMALLRPGMNSQGRQRELGESREFLRELHAGFPTRVTVRELRSRPNFPFLIVDDQIFFGHFANSSVMTPEGFWCRIEGPVESLFSHAHAGTEPSAAESRAALRIISEYVFMLNQAVEVDFG